MAHPDDPVADKPQSTLIMARPTFIKRHPVFVFLLLVSVSPRVYSQHSNLSFESLSVDQGIPTTATCILQDRTGFLWFGTNSGLHKYDGYGFVSYKHDVDDSSSMVDNNVFALCEDKAGVLWVGTLLGLEKFDRRVNTFMHYSPNASATGNSSTNHVLAICEDKYGMLWVGTADGLFRFDRATGTFAFVRSDSTDPGSISHHSVHAICEDKRGALWFATGGGLDKFDFETGKFVHYWNDPGNRYKPWSNSSEHWIQSMCEDDAGILWLGTNGGLVEFNPKKGTFSQYRFDPKKPQNRINSICQHAPSGSLWMATWYELLSFDIDSKTFTHYAYEGNAVYSERSGTLWVGTIKDIKKLNRTKQPFQKYPSKHTVCAVFNGTEGILWLFTYSGFLKFDIRKEQFVPYSFGRGNEPIYVYPDGDVIIRTEKGGCYRQDSRGNIHPFLNDSLKEFVRSLSWGWKTHQGYWQGTHQGGFYFHDPQTYRVTKIRDLKQDVNYIYEDSFGLLWISTSMGKVFCYDPAKDTWIDLVSGPENLSGISGTVITQIYEDKKGRLWFATNNGLNRLERSTNSFIHFTERNGLPSNNIRGILEDDHDFLWLNTSKGISKFDAESNHCKSYDVSYGLELPADVYYGFGCKSRNGEMYFGGANGFTRFHPDSIKDNPFIPPIAVTSFKKFDKPFPFSSEVRLLHDENFLSFEFAALSYISPERNQYAYRLEGLDKDWVNSGTRRYASYPGLEPGEYEFRVKGSNNDGVWNEAGTSISIIIAPPWWKSTWAYVVYSIMLLAMAYLTWKMQAKRIRIAHEYEMSRFEAAKLHEVDEMKSRFFANISHEFRTPLTLILGPVKQMIDASEDERAGHELRVVHKNASRLLDLVNQLLDLSKFESGHMKLRAVPRNIVPLVKGLSQSFCSYAERKRITLNVTSTREEVVVYIDRDKIEKILTNVLSNAFKFTPAGGLIEVSVTEDKEYVNVSISDTGIGIPARKIPRIFDRFYQVDGSHTREQEGTGIGLSLTQELVELHKGKIEVESEEGRGTTITIRIPLGKDHLKLEEICGPGEEEEKSSYLPEVMNRNEETEARKPHAYAAAGLGKRVLLIVEDNADVREYISRNLSETYRILEATDGEDGWNTSIEQMPDIIVSDVMMPKMDGFELCHRLKTDERTSHIPVILLTAKASSQDKIEGFETGADDYIMKPFEPAELEARLRNLVDQRERLHEHFRKHGLVEIEQEKITPLDQRFLRKFFAIITEHMSDASFGVEILANLMAVSRSSLLKKVEALIGEPPNAVIKRTRLNKAAELIKGGFGNISEVALEVGFNNPSYFTESFRKQFGVNPSEYHRVASKHQESTRS